MGEGCTKFILTAFGLLLLGAAGIAAVHTFMNTTSASSWDSVCGSGILIVVLGVFGLTLLTAATHEWGGTYSPQAQPALDAIDQDRSLAQATVEQYRNPEWTDIHRKNVHFDVDYEVFHSRVDGQQVTIARHQQSGTYGVVVDGNVLGSGMNGGTTKRLIQRFFHIDPNLPSQKPMKPDKNPHSKEHGIVEIDDPDKTFWDIF